jgi:hypothetical protein
MKTIDRIKKFLADESKFQFKQKALVGMSGRNSFDFMGVRERFVTSNGYKVSIQQSCSHYCDTDSVEMWCCPHSDLLNNYGDGENPYAYVPLKVVAQYIDELEGK